MPDLTWSRALTAWAARAGYLASSDASSVMFYSQGGELRYTARGDGDAWYQLTFASRGGAEHLELAAATMHVIEHHLFAEFGTVIRDESGLPFLMDPHAPSDVAPGYHVSGMSDDGYRTLSQDGVGPVATARGEVQSLLSLIPLSHYLGLTVAQLEQSLLSTDGTPLSTIPADAEGEQ